ncbi:MAG: sugar transferase [Xanthobacteraceae bacterium]|nr:sugar transferase [Xanthobacteraceae bacterium]
MPARSPSSQSALRLRWSLFDIVWAALAPYCGLTLRDAYILSYDGIEAASVFCIVSFLFSLLAFAVFRLRDGMARYFSVRDAGEIAKAVVMAELMTCTTLFIFTRLEGIPRSTPIVHALLLGVGLILARALVRVSSARFGEPRHRQERKHIVVIGVSRLTALYINFLEAAAPGEHQVIAVLDDEPGTRGRSLNGIGIMGASAELESVIEEFAVHGVRTHRVVVGCHAHEMPDRVLAGIRHICEAHGIDLGFVPQLFGIAANEKRKAEIESPFRQAVSPYFTVKRYLDLALALLLGVALAPLWAFAACLVLLDVGSPVFFWQQRVGLRGRRFLLYKFRTLRNPFDEHGRRLAEAQRVSPIGHFLRRTRLDELPQLLNILFGDMSLIGPRPLLPRDQPRNMEVRLSVRPGITGWAQVNGGVLLSPDEKERLDGWYIRNASPSLDLRIVVLTVMMFLQGDRRTAHVEARLCESVIRCDEPALRRTGPLGTERAIVRRAERVASAALRTS